MQDKISIVIDTNWWITLILSKYKTPLIELFKKERFTIFRCKELTTEICETIVKDKFKALVTEDVFNDFFNRYEGSTRLIVLQSEVFVCRDPQDNFLLALAKDSGSGFLITGDKDLLVLEKFENIIICTLSDFIKNYL